MTSVHAPILLILISLFCISGCENSVPSNAQQLAADDNMREDIELDRMRQLVRELVDEYQQQEAKPIEEHGLENAIAEQLAHRAALETAREMKTGITQNKFVAETIIADSIEAQKIDLVDKQGITRMTIVGDHENDLMGPAVIIRAKDGTTLAHFSETAAGIGLAIYNPEGTPGLTLIVNRNSSGISLMDSTGKPRAMLAYEEGGKIVFADENGKEVVIDGEEMVRSTNP